MCGNYQVKNNSQSVYFAIVFIFVHIECLIKLFKIDKQLIIIMYLKSLLILYWHESVKFKMRNKMLWNNAYNCSKMLNSLIPTTLYKLNTNQHCYLPLQVNYWFALWSFDNVLHQKIVKFKNVVFDKRTHKQSGAVEACWAHNPEVRGSKPRSANILIISFM